MVTSYYPVFLKIGERKCVVVGGGQVARRKVSTLLKHGADVAVISLKVCSELDRLAQNGEIRLIRRAYQSGDLKGAFIAIAATDDGNVNRQVSLEARKTAVLVNVVDDSTNSDFIVPSHISRGDLTIAISTAGRSPALARKIRLRLEKEFGDEYGNLVLLIDEVRTELREKEIRVDGEGWQKALDLDLMTHLLKKGDKEGAKAMLLDNLKALPG